MRNPHAMPGTHGAHMLKGISLGDPLPAQGPMKCGGLHQLVSTVYTRPDGQRWYTGGCHTQRMPRLTRLWEGMSSSACRGLARMDG